MCFRKCLAVVRLQFQILFSDSLIHHKQERTSIYRASLCFRKMSEKKGFADNKTVLMNVFSVYHLLQNVNFILGCCSNFDRINLILLFYQTTDKKIVHISVNKQSQNDCCWRVTLLILIQFSVLVLIYFILINCVEIQFYKAVSFVLFTEL